MIYCFRRQVLIFLSIVLTMFLPSTAIHLYLIFNLSFIMYLIVANPHQERQ